MTIEKHDYHDWIEKYLDGELSAEDNAKFEEMLLADPDLARQYQIRVTLAKNWAKAKQYSEIKEFVSLNVKSAKAEGWKVSLIWSAAASVLILFSISGIIFYNMNVRDEGLVAKKTKNAERKFVPQMKQAEEKASLHIAGRLKLVSPNQNKQFTPNDSIVFVWESDVVIEATLFIVNQKTGKSVYTEKLNAKASTFVLQKNKLPIGEYSWLIEGFPEKENFRIVKTD